MSKDRNSILRFAVGGFGIAVVFVTFRMLIGPLSPWSPLSNILSVMFIILCPPVLLTFPLLDVEIGTGGFYVLWMAVAFLNAGLYAVIGKAYVGMRKRREGEAAD